MRARGARWPWLIVLVALAAAKGETYAALIHHRGAMIAVLAVGLVASALRYKLVAVAAFAAPVLAFAIAPHPFVLGVALGVGAFVFLIALFFAISTVLHARELRPARPRRA